MTHKTGNIWDYVLGTNIRITVYIEPCDSNDSIVTDPENIINPDTEQPKPEPEPETDPDPDPEVIPEIQPETRPELINPNPVPIIPILETRPTTLFENNNGL